jgi:hypothetical protein
MSDDDGVVLAHRYLGNEFITVSFFKIGFGGDKDISREQYAI